MANRLLRQRKAAFLAIAILLILVVPVAYGLGSSNNMSQYRMGSLAASSSGYNESLSLYLTSSETMWQATFSGGNISVPSLSIPSGVTSFSLSLSSYSTWKSTFEIFTKNGFGLLGPFEPMPDGAILTVNASSASDAASFASLLDQNFALVFAPYSNTSSGFTFISPASFQTLVHVYMWKLLPNSYGGFASAFNEQQLESSDLAFYTLSYNSGSYSISIGGLTPLVSTTFSLYTQLGISSSNFTYSNLAASSSVAVHVLGGLVASSNYTYTNHYNNFSASMFESSSGTKSAVPNMNGTLDFSFPTIVASRQIVDLNPKTGQNVSVTVSVRNVSPSGTPVASSVDLNDSWAYSDPTAFKITQGNTSGDQNLSSGQSMTIPYIFTVQSGASGSYTIPQTPVTYQFTAGNKTITAKVFLNTETLTINGTGPAIEAVASISSGAIPSGQSVAVNVTAVNRGSGTAFNLVSAGQTKATLLPGQSWTFNVTSQSAPLTLANSTIAYTVTSQPSGPGSSAQTNTISSTYSFSNPASPASSISKSVQFFKATNTANVTLSVYDSSSVSISNLTVSDSLPAGMNFLKSFEPRSLRFSGGVVDANISSISPNQNISLAYSVNVTGGAQNYVFMPANVSSVWNNETIFHFSQGVGLALGVVASNHVSPSAGFQGSTVKVQVGITNQGALPIFDVALNQSADPFLSITSNRGAFKNILSYGGSLNSSVEANFTGAPGAYNSSSSVASFIFAGYNQTAQSNAFTVTIYEPVQTQMSVTSSKIEEDHDIQIMVEVTNPSNVTVSNVSFSMVLPNNLDLKSGTESFQIQNLAAGVTYKNNLTIYTTLPEQYTLNGTLGFQYNGQTLKGQVSSLNLSIADDLTLRYGIPVLVGLLIVIATLVYLRRLTVQRKA